MRLRVSILASAILLLGGCSKPSDSAQTASNSPSAGASSSASTSGGSAASPPKSKGNPFVGTDSSSAKTSSANPFVESGNIVGSWTDESGMHYKFEKGGEMIETGTVQKLNHRLTFSYKVSGADFTLTLKDASLSSDDPATKSKVDSLQKQLTDTVGIGKPHKGSISWSSKDDFVFTLEPTQAGYEPESHELKRDAG